MKRILATMLVLAMMLAGAAFAEGFVFREGVTWGMTVDEVKAAEGNPEVDVDTMDNLSHFVIEEVDFEGFKTVLNYNFMDDALRMAGYMLDSSTYEVEAVAEVLNGLYGEPTDTDPAELIALMQAFYGDFGWEPDGESYFAGWQLEDGTYVAMTDDFGDIEVAFLDAETLRGSVGEPAPELEEEAPEAAA